MQLNKLSNERIFDFVLTVPEIVDKEGEKMPENELPEALDKWLLNGAPISLKHSNKIIGKGLRWWKDNYKGFPAFFARGIINKNSKLSDMVWNDILNKKYTDVSIGGASWNRSIDKDGAVGLNDLEVLEVAVCEEGMHPYSDIIDVNEFAKSKLYF